MAACVHPGGDETGLARCLAQCLACGRYSVSEGYHMCPHMPHLSQPTSLPVASHLSGHQLLSAWGRRTGAAYNLEAGMQGQMAG